MLDFEQKFRHKSFYAKHKKILAVAFFIIFFLALNQQVLTKKGEIAIHLPDAINLKSAAPSSDTNEDWQKEESENVNGLGMSDGGDLNTKNRTEIEGYIKNVREFGVTWIRWDLNWTDVQSAGADSYDWSKPDEILEIAQQNQMQSVVTIAYAPAWAQNGSCAEDKQCPPRNFDEFAAFAQKAAERYKGKIKYWQVWNEPNTELFWNPKPNPEDYGKLLKASYIKIKAADPQTIVIAGGLAVSGDDGTNVSMFNFIKTLYDTDAHNYFDAIALHPYTYPVTPEYADGWNGWQQMYPIHNLMVEKKEGQKRVWITEYGAPTGGPGIARSGDDINHFVYGRDYVTEADQKSMAEEAIQLYEESRDWMGIMFWYGYQDYVDQEETSENFFGIVRADKSKKPAYSVLQNAIPELNQKQS